MEEGCEGTKELVGSQQDHITNTCYNNAKSLGRVLLIMFVGSALTVFLLYFAVGVGGGKPTVVDILTGIPTDVSRSTIQDITIPDLQDITTSDLQDITTPDHQTDTVTGTPGIEGGRQNSTPGSSMEGGGGQNTTPGSSMEGKGGQNTTPGSSQWFRQQMKRQRKELRQTEQCRPRQLAVLVSTFLNPKDQLLDFEVIPRYVALSRCPGWAGVCQGAGKGCCLPAPGPHPTIIVYIQPWNSTSLQLEDHTREAEYHQSCVCVCGKR